MHRADNLTTFMCLLSSNLGALAYWNPLALSMPVLGLLYSLHSEVACIYLFYEGVLISPMPMSLHVSGIFYAHRQALSTVQSATGKFHAGYVIAS